MLDKTTTAMLEGLVDPENDAIWREFDERFRPILQSFARRLGLTEADAADAAQEALTRFVKAYRGGNYDRDRGRLHTWIIAIARNCIHDLHRDRARRAAIDAEPLDELPNDDDLSRIWITECREAVLSRALERLRAETKTDTITIRAFERLALDQLPARTVADEFGLTLNDVYLAKHRCLKRLRTIVATISIAYELPEARA